MCEHFVARSAEPFRIDELWEMTGRLERYGLAGFGWGAAWLTDAGALGTYRDVRAFRDDPKRGEVGAQQTTAVLVHLRRPSKLSTIGLPDTQPFLDPAGRFALSHNGDLERYRSWRDLYRTAGRIEGNADSEAGARWLEDQWRDGEPVAHLLGALHDTFGGDANLAVLDRSGGAHMYAGNAQNPVFSYRLGKIDVVSTGIYSLDRSLFTYVVPAAKDRRLVALNRTVSLDRTLSLA